MNPPLLIVASHGNMASSAIESTFQIFGRFDNVIAIGLDQNGRLDEFELSILDARKNFGFDRPTLLLVDLFGGSCSNVGAKLLKKQKETDFPLRIIAGFNLAMLIEFAFSRDKYDFDQLVDRILEAGKKACLDVNAKFKVMSR